MKLTVYYDGQFWIGVIEVVIGGKLRAVRHLFGKEPKDSEVLHFVHHQLLQALSQAEQEGVRLDARRLRKINPKRLQRQVSKELKNAGVSHKAQEAIKQELDARKRKKQRLTKEQRERKKNKSIYSESKKRNKSIGGNSVSLEQSEAQ